MHAWARLISRASGIFGYINYLVEKDRKYILNTLINGKCPCPTTPRALQQSGGAAQTRANSCPLQALHV
jgi:hypothetical protein